MSCCIVCVTAPSRFVCLVGTRLARLPLAVGTCAASAASGARAPLGRYPVRSEASRRALSRRNGHMGGELFLRLRRLSAPTHFGLGGGGTKVVDPLRLRGYACSRTAARDSAAQFTVHMFIGPYRPDTQPPVPRYPSAAGAFAQSSQNRFFIHGYPIPERRKPLLVHDPRRTRPGLSEANTEHTSPTQHSSPRHTSPSAPRCAGRRLTDRDKHVSAQNPHQEVIMTLSSLSSLSLLAIAVLGAPFGLTGRVGCAFVSARRFSQRVRRRPAQRMR